MKIGILGGGQLGRMIALAGYPLGMRFRVFDPSAEACAGQVAEQTVGAFEDRQALSVFCEGLDVVTYEWENIPVATAKFVASRVPKFYPAFAALETVQDRWLQKEFLTALGIATASYARIDNEAELHAAVTKIGVPCVLKTRRLGYDGKGQVVLKSADEVAAAWKAVGGAPSVLEAFVPFKREVSIVAARGQDGSICFYPLSENQHREGILRVCLAPAPGLDPRLEKVAQQASRKVMEKLGHMGVLTIEFFETADGELLVNEVATRVHNSGHWTIEGARTSQFENHVRAIAGLPLGSTDLREPVCMVNWIGTMPEPEKIAAVAGAHPHYYGKAPKPGRKLGHVTAPIARLADLL